MTEWLENEVLPKAVASEGFGPDIKKLVGFKRDEKDSTDQFASEIIFGTALLENSAGELVSEPIVIKAQLEWASDVSYIDYDSQFYNELLFYSEILPLLQKYDTENIIRSIFPKFVYGVATLGKNVKDDVLIFKSLIPDGFSLTKEKVFLDKNHIDLALEKIGKFHALTYLCRQDNPEGLKKVVSKIRDTVINLKLENDIDFLSIGTKRGIEPLESDPNYKDKLESIYKNCLKGTTNLRKSLLPSEPLSVICHGDFNRNNMMFKYDSSGKPVDVAFFDLATIKYCSPIIDLSFFLTMNLSNEMRNRYWNELINRYYEALTGPLHGLPEKPTRQEFDDDLKRKGIYGYYLASFFLPFMMEGFSKDMSNPTETSLEKLQEFCQTCGGPEATKMLTYVVKHMLDNDFIFET